MYMGNLMGGRSWMDVDILLVVSGTKSLHFFPMLSLWDDQIFVQISNQSNFKSNAHTSLSVIIRSNSTVNNKCIL